MVPPSWANGVNLSDVYCQKEGNYGKFKCKNSNLQSRASDIESEIELFFARSNTVNGWFPDRLRQTKWNKKGSGFLDSAYGPTLSPPPPLELTSSRKNSMHSFPLLSTTPIFFWRKSVQLWPRTKIISHNIRYLKKHFVRNKNIFFKKYNGILADVIPFWLLTLPRRGIDSSIRGGAKIGR